MALDIAAAATKYRQAFPALLLPKAREALIAKNNAPAVSRKLTTLSVAIVQSTNRTGSFEPFLKDHFKYTELLAH